MIVTLKRMAGFSSAHNYWLPAISGEENRALFGQYAGGEGHGHNYKIEIAVSGPVDERTGMVVNIAEIDRILKTEVARALDGKFLNREVGFFQSSAPTTENIVRYAREQLQGRLPKPAELTGVTVWESETLWAGWSASKETGEMYTLTRAYDFSASHRLHSGHLSDEENSAVFGKCNHPNGHGHNYEIEITLAGTPDKRTGMLFPLEELDSAVKDEVLDPMDHRHLNLDVPEFAHVNPTSEMLSVVIWRRLARRLPTEGDPRLVKVRVRETARNVFEYCGE